MAKDLSSAMKDAKELVMRLEAQIGDPNKMQAHLGKMYERAEAQTPRARIIEQHTIELARAYMGVSDGKGGVDRSAHSTALDRFRNAEKGFMGDGRTPLTSQRDALQFGHHDLLTEDMQKRMNAVPRRSADNVSASHGTEGARATGHQPAKPAVERVSVTTGHARPSRGFASVAMMAATAAVTAIAIPALSHLGVGHKAEEPAIRMAELSRAADGLGAAPATAPVAHEPAATLTSEPVRRASILPARGGPN